MLSVVEASNADYAQDDIYREKTDMQTRLQPSRLARRACKHVCNLPRQPGKLANTFASFPGNPASLQTRLQRQKKLVRTLFSNKKRKHRMEFYEINDSYNFSTNVVNDQHYQVHQRILAGMDAEVAATYHYDTFLTE